MIDSIFWSIFILFIWFKTDAFIQYFFNLKIVKDFESYRFVNPDISFTDFIYLKNPNFWTKLLSCQPCFLFWVLITFSFYYGFSHFAFRYILSYTFFRLLKFL